MCCQIFSTKQHGRFRNSVGTEIGIKNETTCTQVSVKDLYNVKVNNGHKKKQLLENLL